MCGRFTLRTPMGVLIEQFLLESCIDITPRYNIAPTQPIPVIRQKPGQTTRECVAMRWGLIPAWSKAIPAGRPLINARAETVAEKPSFRAPFRHRRALVPADGFYEWQRQGSRKQPYFIHRPDHRPFALAALWETWKPPQAVDDATTILSVTLLTTAANRFMSSLHDRMPVILPPEQWDRWLDNDPIDGPLEQERLGPCDDDYLVRYPVDAIVNSPRHDRPECVTPQPASDTTSSDQERQDPP